MPVVDHDVYGHFVIFQKLPDAPHGNVQNPILRIAVYTGRDQRKGDRFAAVFFRKLQGFGIAGFEKRTFSGTAVLPDRSYAENLVCSVEIPASEKQQDPG